MDSLVIFNIFIDASLLSTYRPSNFSLEPILFGRGKPEAAVEPLSPRHSTAFLELAQEP